MFRSAKNNHKSGSRTAADQKDWNPNLALLCLRLIKSNDLFFYL